MNSFGRSGSQAEDNPLGAAETSRHLADFASAEPVTPQGEYNPDRPEEPLRVPVVVESAQTSRRAVELMAPAGNLDAGYAAFHYGADAVYFGLKKFSARADADNFTPDEAEALTAYAHALQPTRRAYATLNTVLLHDELREALEMIGRLRDIGVDALIVQDLGAVRLVRKYFPNLVLHGSTQMAVHNLAGAETLRDLGFRRVILARELTFAEIREITEKSGIETEVFIHGALCYAYSGLCLFSSQTLGRSGNRGRCAYSCRDWFRVTGAPETLRDGRGVRRNPKNGLPFSMKDLALPDYAAALQAVGVAGLKIEGRKKSPLYVAAAVSYYRVMLAGSPTAEKRRELEGDFQTVFSRPWTRLFMQSPRDKETADRDTAGHRGTPIGRVERVVKEGETHYLRFKTARALERHDGLQLDLPDRSRPFGFAVDRLFLPTAENRRHCEVIVASAGALVEVVLPSERPPIPVGAQIYCASSQAVKRTLRFTRPKPGLFRRRVAADFTLKVEPNRLTLRAVCGRGGAEAVTALAEFIPKETFPTAQEPQKTMSAAQSALAKLGDTRFSFGSLFVENSANLFVPVSALNELRRCVTTALEAAWRKVLAEETERICREEIPVIFAEPSAQERRRSRTAAGGSAVNLLKADRAAYFDAFEKNDWEGVAEVVVEIARDKIEVLAEKLDALDAILGRERVRLALPILTRKWEEKDLRKKIERFLAAGRKLWETANLSGWSFLGLSSAAPLAYGLNLTADWPLYALNPSALRQLFAMGVERATLSPEDGWANIKALATEFGSRVALIVHQDTPLFIAESCAYANLIGGCPGRGACAFEKMAMTSVHGENAVAWDHRCRTVVTDEGPFCIANRITELKSIGIRFMRADFICRTYSSEEVRNRWRMVRAGNAPPKSLSANFDRGLL
jgi:putative protease